MCVLYVATCNLTRFKMWHTFYVGYVDAAMNTALQLRDYDDVINPADVYSLIGNAEWFDFENIEIKVKQGKVQG